MFICTSFKDILNVFHHFNMLLNILNTFIFFKNIIETRFWKQFLFPYAVAIVCLHLLQWEQ